MRWRTLALFVAAVLGAAAKEPVTHEALYLMKRVGDPVVSPDGKWVVFSVTEPAYDPKEQVSDVWIVPSDGSAPPRRLTATKSGESGLAWSPDSKRLAFSAKREGDEVNQIYILDVAQGGEALRVTSISTGAHSPLFSPDGSMLLFTSSVYPGAADDEANKKIAAERKARKYNARLYDGFPIRYWDRWVGELRPRLFVQAATAGAKPRDLLTGTRLASSAGFGGRPRTDGAGQEESLDPVWTPDGKSVVFVATAERDAGAYRFPLYRLYEVPVAGGEPRQISADMASYSSPTFSPDGKQLYAERTPRTAKVYNLARLARWSWPAQGDPEILTAGFDRSVEAFVVGPNRVWLTAEDSGHVRLYWLEAGKVQPAEAAPAGAYSGLSISTKAAEPVLVASWGSSVHPAEIFRIESGTRRALTSFNTAEAEKLDWLPPLHFTFTSKKGRTIHNMLIRPPAFDPNRKYPVVHIIHGGPNNMWRDQITLRWNYHLLAAPGYVILLTNYTGSTGFGEQFAQWIEGDPFFTPGEELDQALEEAARRFPFADATRACAGGASYGGSLANWLLATTDRYRCLINHAGIFNLESMWGTTDIAYWMEARLDGPVWEQGEVWRKQNPARYAANFKTPILVTHGENDFRVPIGQALELWSVLQRRRVPGRLIVFPDENHWILKPENSRFFYQEVHRWLAEHLRP